MMNSMNSVNYAASVGFWGLHLFAMLLLLVGLMLVVLWTAKTLNQNQLKTWGIGLVAVGAVLALLTTGIKGSLWKHKNDYGAKAMPLEMVDTNRGHMGHDMSTMDPMEMSMNDMDAMLQGKAGDAFDKAFIEGMIPHHQGAINMAKLAKQNAKHPEIKEMADAIISAQQEEIDQMNQWMQEWGYTE